MSGERRGAPERVELAGAEELQLERELGHGGMGTVWLARQQALGREVAVKRLHPGLAAGPNAQRFAGEALIMGRLEHPNIVPVHAFGKDEADNPCLCMKVVRGIGWDRLLFPQTPEEELRAARLELHDHLRILQQVCEAIAFANAHGIVHRDLKPANVMIGDFGEVLVTDWGIALDLARRPPPGTADSEAELVGTPDYLAPEMTSCDPWQIGPWTDVYQLGGILYTLLTGTTPHRPRSLYEAILAARTGEVEPPHERAPGRVIPPDLAELALRALRRDPRERPQRATELIAGIEDHFRNEAATRLAAVALERLGELERAIRTRARRPAEIYAGLDRCIAELGRAAGLWPGQGAPAEGLNRARLTCAAFALAQGNPAVAEAQLERLPSDLPRVAELRRQAAALRAVQQCTPWRRRRLVLGLVAAVLVAALAVGLGIWAARRAARLEQANERRRQALHVVDGATWKTSTDKIALYRRALVLDPSWPEGYIQLSGSFQDRAYEQRNRDPAACAADLELSAAVLQPLLAVQPDHAPALLFRSYAREMRGDVQEMLADCRRVVELAPETDNGLAAGTLLALAERRWADAERLTSRSIDAGGGDEDTFTRRAFARFVLGDLTGGLADIERMAQKNPEQGEYDAYAALFLLAQGKRHRAAERLVGAVEKAPGAPQVLPLLAYFAARRGDREQAQQVAGRARAAIATFSRCYLDFDPVDRTVAQAPPPRDVLGRALVLDLDLATVASDAPGLALGLRRQARTLLEAGDAAGALAFARRALADDPTDGEAHLLHGAALVRLGQPGPARYDLRLAAVLAPERAADARALLPSRE